jgi:hypothetical protein
VIADSVFQLFGGDALSVFLLFFHLLAVNAMISVPWIAAHLEFLGYREEAEASLDAPRRLGAIAVVGAGAVILLGAGAFLTLSVRVPDFFFSAVVRLKPVFFFFSVLLSGFIALLFAYHSGWKWRGERPVLHVAIAVGAGALALLLSAFFTALSLAAGGLAAASPPGSGLWKIAAEAAFLPRLLHTWFAAFATGGIVLMMVGRRAFRWEGGASLAEGARLIRAGALWALLASVLQVAAGVWYLGALPEGFRGAILGGDPGLTVAFAVAAVGFLALAETLVSVLHWRGGAPRAAAIAAAFVVLITFSLTSARARMVQLQNLPGGAPAAVFRR